MNLNEWVQGKRQRKLVTLSRDFAIKKSREMKWDIGGSKEGFLKMGELTAYLYVDEKAFAERW